MDKYFHFQWKVLSFRLNLTKNKVVQLGHFTSSTFSSREVCRGTTKNKAGISKCMETIDKKNAVKEKPKAVTNFKNRLSKNKTIKTNFQTILRNFLKRNFFYELILI